ncbi:hypothetical protein GGQ62_001079 [Polymorphobacter fuscus]|nr:hypothetical protein [Polymorphobacter fuscus]
MAHETTRGRPGQISIGLSVTPGSDAVKREVTKPRRVDGK